MSTTTKVTVGGVFSSEKAAHRAVEELRQGGFSDSEIIVVPGVDDESNCRSDQGITVETGARVGMMTGAALGGLAGGFPGLVLGAAAGTLLGGFIDLGIPEDAACFYRDEHDAGRTVVLIRSTRSDEAANLLRFHGAKDVRIMEDTPKQQS